LLALIVSSTRRQLLLYFSVNVCCMLWYDKDFIERRLDADYWERLNQVAFSMVSFPHF